MYYIVKHGETLNTIADACTHHLAAAKAAADDLHSRTGDHYHVIKVETVWTTTTLNDILNEKDDRVS
jgi:hypothetical protein